MSAAEIELLGGSIPGVLALLIALVKIVTNGDGHRAEVANQLAETEIRKQQDDDRRRDELLDELNESRQRLTEDCQLCREEVRSLRAEFYRLLKGIEDQIIPMLNADQVNPTEVRSAIRIIVEQARQAL